MGQPDFEGSDGKVSRRKIKLTISYDGTGYGGFQIQPNAPTIQQHLEEAISNVAQEQIKIIGSGRTDAGVHARGQVIHFESGCSIPPERWPLALNRLLPADIVVVSAEEVPDSFHARFDVKAKTYQYLIYNAPIKDVFLRQYSWHVPQPLDDDLMDEASRYLSGRHDFTSFCSPKTEITDRVREISRADVSRSGQLIRLTFRGNGFLYNMVRIITGTLVEIGLKKRSPEEIKEILAARDREHAGPTAPPQGLCLWEVSYDNS